MIERGFSMECENGQHAACGNKLGCPCGCHRQQQQQVPVPVAQASASSMVCQTCAKVPKAGDVYCRQDGSRLVAGKICSCGRGMEPVDAFCGGCGRKFVTPGATEPMIDAAAQMESEEFKALEAELAARSKSRPSDVEAAATEVR